MIRLVCIVGAHERLALEHADDIPILRKSLNDSKFDADDAHIAMAWHVVSYYVEKPPREWLTVVRPTSGPTTFYVAGRIEVPEEGVFTRELIPVYTMAGLSPDHFHKLRRFLRPMQCKDIPDQPILAFLAERPGVWHNWCCDDELDVSRAMPHGVPGKLRIAKMGALMRRGMVGGCDCGCRGDFVITEKGLALLSAYVHEPSH